MTCIVPTCNESWEQLYSVEYPICYKCRQKHRRFEFEGKMIRHTNGRLSAAELADAY